MAYKLPTWSNIVVIKIIHKITHACGGGQRNMGYHIKNIEQLLLELVQFKINVNIIATSIFPHY